MRSLFLLYLEDREATSKDFYEQFDIDAKSYFDILKEPNYTYELFKKLAEDFNGSLFTVEDNEKQIVTYEHLELIKKCFTNGNLSDEQIDLFPDWRLFNFSIIRIELLSEIYENFLNELDKKETGTYYTPPSLVELILNEKLPVNSTDFNIKTLDPSCGSGIFLVQSFKRLVKRYEKKYKLKQLTDFITLVEILKTNIYGIEIDEKSIKVAAFSLYLALLDNLNPKTGWWNKTIQFPYLINDPNDNNLKEQGNNLYRRDTISDLSNIEELSNFQLVVGNPPFGTKNLLPNITNYCNENKFAKEMVLPFLHKATLFAPDGEIALIFNTKILTNTGGTYQNFREWLFNKNHVEKIYNFSILRKAKKNFGGQLFGSAVGPISIVFYKKEIPENANDSILYYAPKTYIKNDVLECIVIDQSDIKFLPRAECHKPNTKIWKIAMWGSFYDFELIEKIYNTNSLNNDLIKNHIKSGVGFQLLTDIKDNILKNDFISESKYLDASCIERYSTNNNRLNKINSSIKSKKAIEYYNKAFDDLRLSNINSFRRLGDLEAYKGPHVLLKKGLDDNLICASFLEIDCTFRDGVYGFYSKDENQDYLKSMVSLLNSRISSYLLFLTISSYGIEREQVMKNEFLSLPYTINEDCQFKLSALFNEISSIKKSNEVFKDISLFEKEIDQIIYNDILKLSKDEQIIIQDTLDYSLDLFEKQENSNALKPVKAIKDFSERLVKNLNEWLQDIDFKVSLSEYNIPRNCPLYMIKISFGNETKLISTSQEDIYKELKKLDKKLIEEKTPGLYFRKKLNYYHGNDVYIIKPNQRRFWSQTAAMEDCKNLLAEILKMK